MDSVAEWEASRALKGDAEGALADLLRALKKGARPEEVALALGDHLEALIERSGLPIGVAVTAVGGGRKDVNTLLEALEVGGFPSEAIAEIRAALGKGFASKSRADLERAAALARVPAIPLPEHPEDPAAALARVPAISLPMHLDVAGEPRAVADAEACAPEAVGHTDQTEEPTAAAEAGALAPGGAAHTVQTEEVTSAAKARARLARMPAICLPEHLEGACEPSAATEAGTPASKGAAQADQTDEATAAAEGEALAPEGARYSDQTKEAAAAEAGAPGGPHQTDVAEVSAPQGPSQADEREEATVRTVARSAAAVGIRLTTDELHMAARVVDHLRIRASGMTQRAAHFQRSVLRRPRAPRAPRRAARRTAVAPSRDGPPSPSDPPAPVAARSPRGAVGGPR